jgi:hypothetical protein
MRHRPTRLRLRRQLRLGAKVAKRRRAENWRYGIVLTVAVLSAMAAVIAAWPVIKSWF